VLWIITLALSEDDLLPSLKMNAVFVFLQQSQSISDLKNLSKMMESSLVMTLASLLTTLDVASLWVKISQEILDLILTCC